MNWGTLGWRGVVKAAAARQETKEIPWCACLRGQARKLWLTGWNGD
jgi:hypothetical protein